MKKSVFKKPLALIAASALMLTSVFTGITASADSASAADIIAATKFAKKPIYEVDFTKYGKGQAAPSDWIGEYEYPFLWRANGSYINKLLAENYDDDGMGLKYGAVKKVNIVTLPELNTENYVVTVEASFKSGNNDGSFGIATDIPTDYTLKEKALESGIAYNKDNRVLVWHEEFDGDALDSSSFGFERSMDNSDIAYSNDAQNVKVCNGNLVLKANRTENGYTTAEGLSTKKTMAFKYGYLEMRARVPYSHGAWPSLWAKSSPTHHEENVGWGAEVDIFEVFSSTNKLYPNLHKYGHDQGPHYDIQSTALKSNGYTFADGADLNDYHIYGFEWTKDYMKFYVDGVCYQTYDLNAPIILEKGNEVEFKFGINDGYYEFSPVFRPISSTAQSVKYSVMTDGKIPFDGADNLTAQVWFVDDGKLGKLSTGDETAPTQRQSDEDMESFAYDKTGINGDFYRLKFNTGIHTVKIKCQDEPFKITALLLKRVKETEKYSDVEKNYNGTEKYNGAPIIVEGESPVLRNDYSLTAKADNSDIKVTPNDSKHSVINYIGGENWAKPYQEIVWETQVPKDGLYAVDFFFKQNSIINGCAFRSLKIDGEIPFAEAKTIAFPYKTAWQNMRLKDENGNEALLRLTKGKHRISLCVTLGTVAEVYKSLQGITEKVGSMYLDVVMITGETPDSNRDYELYKQIPDYETRLEDIYDELSSLSAVLKSRSDINGELDAAVRNMMRAVKKMHDERYKSHMYLDTYYSYYQTLCSWLFDIKDMSLSLDKIVLSTPGRKCEVKSGGFFKAVWFTLKRFAVSFTGDYTLDLVTLKAAFLARIEIFTETRSAVGVALGSVAARNIDKLMIGALIFGAKHCLFDCHDLTFDVFIVVVGKTHIGCDRCAGNGNFCPLCPYLFGQHFHTVGKDFQHTNVVIAHHTFRVPFTNHNDKVFFFAKAAEKRVFAVLIHPENNLAFANAESVFNLVVFRHSLFLFHCLHLLY